MAVDLGKQVSDLTCSNLIERFGPTKMSHAPIFLEPMSHMPRFFLSLSPPRKDNYMRKTDDMFVNPM